MRQVLDRAYVNFAGRLKLGWPKRLGLRLIKKVAASFVSRMLVERRSGLFQSPHVPSAGEKQAFIRIDNETYPLANTGGWLRIDGTGAADGENAGLLVIDQMGPRWESLQGSLR